MVFKTAVMCVFDGHRLLLLPYLRPMQCSHRNHRNNHRRCFIKKDVLQNSQENTDVGVSFQQSYFIKKRLQQKFFPLNIAKYLRTLVLKKSANVCFWNEPIINNRVKYWFPWCRNIKWLKKKHLHSLPRKLQVALQSIFLFWY